MNRLTRKYKSLFDSADPLPIFFLRITIGLIFIFHYATHFNVFITIYSWKGLAGIYRNTMNLNFEGVYWALYCLLLLSAVCLVLGFKSRLSLAISTLLHLFFISSMPAAYWGWGSAILFFSYFLMICDPGRILSLDLFLAKESPRPIEKWKIKFIQLMVCSIYLIVTLNRIGSKTWADGTAVMIGLSNIHVARFPLFPWQNWRPLLSALSYGTLLLEGLGIFLIFFGRYTKYVLAGLFLFHFLTEVLMTVGYWQHLMIAALTSFLPQTWSAAFYEFFDLRKPGRTRQFKFNYRPVILFILWVFIFFAGFPRYLTPATFLKLRAWEYNALSFMKLNSFRQYNLFSRPTPFELYCSFVMREKNGMATLIYQADLDDCLDRHSSFSVDHLNVTHFIMSDYSLRFFSNEEVQKSYKHIGEYYCRGDLESKIHFVEFEYRHPIEQLHYSGPRIPRVKFSYDCTSKEIFSAPIKQVINLFRAKYDDILKRFKSRGFDL